MLKPSSSLHHFIFYSDPEYEILSKKGLFLGWGGLGWQNQYVRGGGGGGWVCLAQLIVCYKML